VVKKPMEESQWTVETLLKTSGSYWETCTLHAGVRMDIFTLIGDGSLRGEEAAERLGGDPRGITTLLNGLTAMGLLMKKEGKYANSAPSKSLLTRESPRYIGHIIKHHSHLVPAWSELHKAALSGRPVGRGSYGEEERESFLMGMFNLAMGIAPHLAKEIDLIDRRHLLDLGGGPGTYAIHFCLENPGLRGTVWDLPETRPFAITTVERFGLTGRVDFIAGDYLKDDLEGSYDVAWLSHILHGQGPGECERLVEKSVSVLEPGGLIMIHDFLLNVTLDSPLFPALFSLNMLLNTKEGRSYSQDQVMGMLSRAGVKDIHRLRFRGPMDSCILSGTV